MIFVVDTAFAYHYYRCSTE